MSSVIVDWITQQGTSGDDTLPNIAVDNSGHVYLIYLTTGQVPSQHVTGGYVLAQFDATTGFMLQLTQIGLNIMDRVSLLCSGNFIYLAYTTSNIIPGQTNIGQTNVVVQKIDHSFVSQWIVQHASFNTTGYDNNPNIAIDSYGFLYVTYMAINGTASGQSSTGASNNIIVFKLDQSGNTLWVRQQASFNTDEPNWYPSIAADAVGNSYLAYYTSGTASGQTSSGGYDLVVFALNLAGQTLWIKQQPIFNTPYNDDNPSLVVDTTTGSLYVSYMTEGGQVSGQTQTNPYGDIVILKLETLTGQVVWVSQKNTFNAFNWSAYPAISLDSVGQIYVAYHTYQGVAFGQTYTGGQYDIVVFKMDATSGETIWVLEQPSFNTTKDDTHVRLALDPSDNIYLTYMTTGVVTGLTSLGGNTDIVLFRLSPVPAQLSLETYTGALPAGLIIAGDLLTYTYGVRNIGAVDLSQIQVKDNKGNLLFYMNEIPGQLQTQTATYVITQAEINQGSVASQAKATSSDNCVAIKTLSITITQVINVLLTYSGVITPGLQIPGTLIVYQYQVTNPGNVPLSQVTLTDTKAGLILLGLLDPLQSIHAVGTYALTQNDINLGSVSSQVIVKGVFGSVAVTAQATWLITLTQTPSLTLEIYQATLPTSPMISANQNVTYTYVIQNTGNVIVSQVTLQDTLGYMLVIGVLPSQQTYTTTFLYPLTQSDLDLGLINSQANVTGHYLSQVLTSEKSLTLNLPQISSVYLSKKAIPIEGQFQYTIDVTNLGNVTLHDVTLSDPLFNLTLTIGLLLPFTTHTEQVMYQPTASEIASGIVFNTANVSGLGPQNQPVHMDSKIASVPCLYQDTLITMQDGTDRKIQDLKRGDWVKPGHQVARLCKHQIDSRCKIAFLLFNVGTFGPRRPYRELLITRDHPIIFQHARRPAKVFDSLMGVCQVMMQGISYLYDLQFDHEGTYLANGLEVQSCSPRSLYQPLSKELYWDPSLYTSDVVADTYNHPLVLDCNPLDPMIHRQQRETYLQLQQENKVKSQRHLTTS